MRYKSGILAVFVLLSSSFVLASTSDLDKTGQTDSPKELDLVTGSVAGLQAHLAQRNAVELPSPGFLLLRLQEIQAQLALFEEAEALNLSLFEFSISVRRAFDADLSTPYSNLSAYQQEVYVELLTVLSDLENLFSQDNPVEHISSVRL